jgi:hypothetical protein
VNYRLGVATPLLASQMSESSERCFKWFVNNRLFVRD